MGKLERIDGQADRELAGQLLRYGVSGVGLAALYAAVYWAAGRLMHLPPQAANAAGFVAALVTGYLLHSRWSFRGYGSRRAWSVWRFAAVNLSGYALNCLWVWLVVERFAQPLELAIVPIVTLTPAFTFFVNRRWTFA